jgi:hypothetical protein
VPSVNFPALPMSIMRGFLWCETTVASSDSHDKMVESAQAVRNLEQW